MTNEKSKLSAALNDLSVLSARWDRNDLPNNPVRRAFAILSDELDNPEGDPEKVLFDRVRAGEFSREDAEEALARFYGCDEDGREVREDGARV